MKNYRLLGLGAIATLLIASSAYAQSVQWLGNLYDDGFSTAYDVSGDGQVVIGEARSSIYSPLAFRWTPQTGMERLSNFNPNLVARAVSADGTVVVCYDFFGTYRWTATLGEQQILGFDSQPWGVSADGSVIVGKLGNRAFRWTAQTGAQILPTDDPNPYSAEALAVSADGAVVVGYLSALDNTRSRLFRWTEQSGVEYLQDWGTQTFLLPETVSASADGQTVVGAAYDTNQQVYRSFRWTAQTGFQYIGELDNHIAHGVSGDGATIVGRASFGAFRWTESGGIEYLNQTYANLLNGDIYFYGAYAISSDGRYIVGDGYVVATRRVIAYLLDTNSQPCGDANGDGVVDDADLLVVLFNFDDTGSEGDVNNDGVVDDADLLVVLFNFGNSC
ncbi:MAG: hypothetical protein NZM28_10470 [Fimbriimonadales bacterium]|nr:hypothetical protein [Fimbriimonadales bacterium]